MNNQVKILRVICRWGQEAGFRLGGADAAPVNTAEEFNLALEAAIHGGDVGVLAIPEDMEAWISRRNLAALKRAGLPIIARYHYPQMWDISPGAEKYTERMAYRAIGFHFRIKFQ